MKIFLTLSLFFVTQLTIGQETTTYYFIRHAEKEKNAVADRNPHLNEKGKQRALFWKDMLAKTPLDAVYSTSYFRTKETAQPVAQDHNLPILTYNPGELFSAEFQEKTKGKIILIVGHSNTTPQLANLILQEKKYTQIDENTFGNLYILQHNGNGFSAQLLQIENIVPCKQ